MALAYRAGVPLKDMEMVQFHPTCLPGTGILITEAARGEGGYLVNKDGERYMQRYLPSKMELGPRDILSRAMIQEMKAGRAFEGPYGLYMGLDLRHLGAKKINERIPMVRELAEKYMGLDPIHELIPVRPGQHYIMGGVSTNGKGETTLPGLYAVGETASVSINGALPIAHSARNRRESRGAHSRTDFPQRDDANYLKHTLAFRTDGPPRIDYVPVTVTKWQPVERKY